VTTDGAVAWRHQDIALAIEGQCLDISQRLVVQICHPDIDLEIVEGALDLLPGLREHTEGDTGVAGMKWRGQPRYHG